MTTNSNHSPDLETISEQLRATQGRQFWRSLDQLADSPEFREIVEREFPQGAAEMADPVTRRTFLKLMGASLALAGVTGCAYQPRQYFAPFDRQPEGRVPGVPIYYSSAMTLGGYASGVRVKSNDGRPTKIEGNREHPASLGATDIFTQAAVLTMYDPERSFYVLEKGQQSAWENAVAAITAELAAQAGKQGAGLRLLTETITSPSLASQIDALLAMYPQARWYQYEPINRDNVLAGARMAFGEDVETRYELAEARVVLSLDADFLAPGPGYLVYARAFADGRKVTKETAEMNRLYVVEAMPSNTGMTADHRLALKAGQVEAFARALAEALGVEGIALASVTWSEAQTKFLEMVAKDLREHQGAGVVIAGDQQPPAVHAIAHAINAALGNVGRTVLYTEPVVARPTIQIDDLRALVSDIDAGQVDVLVMLGGNPRYTAPADLGLGGRLDKVPFTLHLSLYRDETSAKATWHIPAAHWLESWGDARAFDGTASIVQPLILPLYGGKSAYDVLSVLLGSGQSGYDIVRAYWQTNAGFDNFERDWQVALSQGLIKGTAAPAKAVTVQTAGIPAPTAPAEGLEIVFRPDSKVWDGSFTNNGWLQEIPDPITKLVWDNAALMSPRTADKILGLGLAGTLTDRDYEKLSAANGRYVSLNYKGGQLNIPVWIVPGHAEDSVTVSLGYGRTEVGQVGRGAGFNAYLIRTSDAPWFGGGLTVAAGSGSYQLVSTQDHFSMEGRDLVRVGVFEEFKKDPKYVAKEHYEEKYGSEEAHYQSILRDYPYTLNKWGMVINMNACIGCNVCTTACQAENNIPVVGKDQVARGREMHWIRIDRYYGGDLDNPSLYAQPITCMHCEQAPCEIVCPVAATVHDAEGLNQMVYNRCVGTKYCSNNCPYKVRRFNFYQYNDLNLISLKLMRNPDVTVRNRGVMEKCTFCVQRISEARIAAKREAAITGQPQTIPDGTLVMACEAACPTGAITFGDLNDANSRVTKLAAEPHNYGLLGELNTYPRVTYLTRIRNPNPELEGEV